VPHGEHAPSSSPPVSELRVHVALLGVQIAFASGAIAGKLVLNGEGVDATGLACLRAMGGAVGFHVARAWWVRDGAAAAKIPLRDHARLFLYAVLGVAVNQAFFLHGLKRATATSATLLAATIPVFTAGVAVLARQEKITLRTAIGLALASTGVLTLTGVRDVSVGNLLVTLNSLAYSAYLVGVRPLLRKYGALTAIAWVFTYGALMMMPVGLLPLVRDVPHWSTRATELVLFYLAVPTLYAYLANAFALARAKPTVVAGYIYLQPVLVTVAAWMILGEKLTGRLAVAAATILVGLTVIVARRADAERRAEAQASK
jgi:drug/metabolite transporter (DMT)-like permease